ncbi:hypothetical protein [Paraconexibacter sp. AEG42_29]|uniref:hypothetical protein n=1 Tax=Paraconexibacter sp. AEG42_29 TaxID=2997339 RepID=UPI00339D8619
MVDEPSRPPAGAAPQQVADLLRTFSGGAATGRRRRRPREDAPDTIVPLLVEPDETPLDPSRIEAARARLKEQAAAAVATAAAEPAAGAQAVDPAAFDAARSRLRTRRSRPSSPPQP